MLSNFSVNAFVAGCASYLFWKATKRALAFFLADERNNTVNGSQNAFFNENSLKMVIVVWPENQIRLREKCIEAVCKAYSLGLKINQRMVVCWKKFHEAKVVVKVKSVTEMEDLQREAKARGIVTLPVEDDQKRIVVLVVGPGVIEKINEVTGHLKLL